MTSDTLSDLAVPPALAARLQEAAAAQHRPPREVLRDAVELYLREQRPFPPAHRSPGEAAARIRRSRPGNKLPDGVTIRDLMTYGRA
jgi:predicted transcriptional regulator